MLRDEAVKKKIRKCRCTKRMGRKKVLPSCGLTRLASLFLFFKFGQWKSTQANKDGSQSPNLGNWTVILCGGFMEKNWRVYIPLEYFTQSFTKAAILIQFYFDLCNCSTAQAQHGLVYIFLKKNNACRQLSQGNKTAFRIHFHFFFDKFSCVPFMFFFVISCMSNLV